MCAWAALLPLPRPGDPVAVIVRPDPVRLSTFAGGAVPVVLTLGGAAVPEAALGPIRINHGRASADVRPEPPTCTVSLRVSALSAWPVIGTALVVTLSDEFAAAAGITTPGKVRFTGRVTDPRVNPASDMVQITATGDLARVNAFPVGDAPWPAELDGARAARILALVATADPTVVVGLSDPGTVTVLARDVDRQPASSLLADLAACSGGDAWQSRGGVISWHDANYRLNADPILSLTAAEVLSGAEWVQSLDGLVTDLTVGYGAEVFDPVDGTTSQATVTVTDPVAADPVTGLGLSIGLAATISTELATEADATAYATAVVGRRSRPRWHVPNLAVDMLRTITDPADRAALAAAEPGVLVAVTGLPTTGPVGSSNAHWVEGWAEEITALSWRMSLAVTPRGLTGPQPRWLDIPLTYTPPAPPGGTPSAPVTLSWGSPAIDGLSWLSAVGWWPGDDAPDAGRWADVPGTVHWNTYSPTTTWDDLL